MILDPDREWRITKDSLQYLNRISAFVGLEGRGVPETVLVRGQGGIHDHLGGGFARYTTNEQWLIPHFEKTIFCIPTSFSMAATAKGVC